MCVCVCVCVSAGGTLPANRPEQALRAGAEGGGGGRRMAVRRGGAATSQSHGTTQQDNKPSSLSISVSLSLFLSAAECGKRNLRAASGLIFTAGDIQTI